ncbi:hypothetical protein B5G16_12025 [Alistipes sp. An66]|nr:hypothetical protein B5G16_12025 [Alistipes sp. An66]
MRSHFSLSFSYNLLLLHDNLPLSIGSGARAAAQLGATVLGFHLFGSGFLWVVLVLLFCSNLLRGIFSCLLSFVVLIGLFSFLFMLIC